MTATREKEMAIEGANHEAEIPVILEHPQPAWGIQTTPRQTRRIRTPLAVAKAESMKRSIRLSKIISELANLELDNKPEKPLGLRLNLYQMEH